MPLRRMLSFLDWLKRAPLLQGIRPAPCPNQNSVRLEPPGQLDKFPELVDLQPEGLTAVGHRSIWAAPTGDGGKAPGYPIRANRPQVQDHRLSNRTPRDVPGRNRTWQSSDIFGDGEVEIVAGQARPWDTCRMPVLREARIDINVGLAAQAAPEWFPAQMAADIHKEVGAVGPCKKLSVARTIDLLAVVIDQCGTAGQAKLSSDFLEVGQVHRAFKRRYRPGCVDTVFATDLLHEKNIETEPFEAEAPVQAHPGLATIEALVGQGPADDDAFHRLGVAPR